MFDLLVVVGSANGGVPRSGGWCEDRFGAESLHGCSRRVPVLRHWETSVLGVLRSVSTGLTCGTWNPEVSRSYWQTQYSEASAGTQCFISAVSPSTATEDPVLKGLSNSGRPQFSHSDFSTGIEGCFCKLHLFSTQLQIYQWDC